MTWVAVAIVGSSIVSAYYNKKGTDEQVKAANIGQAENKRQFDILQQNFEPFRQTGLEANKQLDQALSGDISGFQKDPGFELQRQEGERSINRLAAQQGRLNTGAQAKDLSRFNQGLANQSYGQYVNRLLAISGRGQSATEAVGQAGQNFAGRTGAYATQAGNARASGYQGYGNIVNNAINQYALNSSYKAANKPQQNYYANDRVAPGGSFPPSRINYG